MARYWWFQGASVDKLTDELLNGGDNPRLEVYLKGDRMTLRVAGDTERLSVEEGTIDESHPCPPQCIE